MRRELSLALLAALLAGAAARGTPAASEKMFVVSYAPPQPIYSQPCPTASKEPSLSAPKVATIPSCTAFRAYRGTERHTSAATPDHACWVKAQTSSGTAGWVTMFLANASNPLPCAQTGQQDWTMWYFPPETCKVPEVQTQCKSYTFSFANGGYTKSLVASLKVANAWSCCYECSLCEACAAFSWQAMGTGSVCNLTSDAQQADQSTATYKNDLQDLSATLAGNVPELRKRCDANPKCLGFTTGGWLKHTIRAQSSWTATPASWATTHRCPGMYVKKVRLANTASSSSCAGKAAVPKSTPASQH
ncbi:hypothetical protein ABPG75_000817 [Micractinium tetrahymenae]